MLEVKSKKGEVQIVKIMGTPDRVVGDIGAIAHKVMLTIANYGAKSKEEVYIKYGILAKKLVGYIEETVHRVDDIEEG